MFRNRTVFVIGAGASVELNLPSGAQLVREIASLLNYRFDGFELQSGDPQIRDAIIRHSQNKNGVQSDYRPYIYGARHISSAMPLAPSIDTFIDNHKGNEIIETCGKLAIVKSIIAAERRSHLFNSENIFRPNRFENTWVNRFFKILVTGAQSSDPSGIFNNVSFVVFNYDRCVEHSLFESLKTYFGIDNNSATSLVKNVKILHPYGVIGELPWESPNGIAFGGTDGYEPILEMSSEIKTFSEQIEDTRHLNEIRNEIYEAETLVFLGFAFHPQNMALLSPGKQSRAGRAFATAVGMSDTDRAIVRRDIARMLNKPEISNMIEVRNDRTCTQLFDEYFRSLSAS